MFFYYLYTLAVALTLQGSILISFLILWGKANIYLIINFIIFKNPYEQHFTRKCIRSNFSVSNKNLNKLYLYFSPELVPFQFAGGPLADEADNADMTPQCMPVIDPNFVRENFIEGCVLGKSSVLFHVLGNKIQKILLKYAKILRIHNPLINHLFFLRILYKNPNLPKNSVACCQPIL